jgi:hypothetical protein
MEKKEFFCLGKRFWPPQSERENLSRPFVTMTGLRPMPPAGCASWKRKDRPGLFAPVPQRPLPAKAF